MQTKDFLLALLITGIWGFNFVVIKTTVHDIPPLLLAALRFLLAALPAVFFIKPPKTSLFNIVAYGVCVGVVQFGLLYMGMKMGMSAGLSSLIMQTQVFFTLFLSVLFLNERIQAHQVIGLCLAVAGMLCIASISDQSTTLVGFLMLLGGAMGWGISNIVVKKAGNIDMFSFTVYTSLVSPIPLFLLSGFVEGWGNIASAIIHADWKAWLAILYMSYGNTILGFGVWSWLIAKYNASTVAPLSLLVPVFGMLSSALFLHEHFSAIKLLAVFLVFSGLLTTVFGGRYRIFSRAS